MTGFCSVCRHTQRDQIDALLIKGQPFRKLSPKFGVSPPSLSRHKRQHLAAMLAKIEAERAEDIHTRFRNLEAHARRLLRKAEEAKDYSAAISALRETARLIALAEPPPPPPDVSAQRVSLSFSPLGVPSTRILPVPAGEQPIIDAELDVEIDPADGAALL
jgi:hypothetical protein